MWYCDNSLALGIWWQKYRLALRDIMQWQRHWRVYCIVVPFLSQSNIFYLHKIAWGDKVQFLDLRAALPFLGALDYIFWDGNIGFYLSCKKVPPKSDLLFALYLVNPKKKFFLCVKKKIFCRNELHLVRGFQKGITLGISSQISRLGWVVGVACGGRCGVASAKVNRS